MKSKLSGSRQVFAAAFNTFPRPIPTPVHNLRPAQDTCEQCHWPKKFYGGQLKVFTHFSNDEKNTLRQVRLLIKTGGGDPATGAPEGIHWHMNIGNKIDYVAADDKRQVIPYVHVRDLQGRVTEYYAKDSTLTKDQIAKAPTSFHGLRRLPQPSHAHLCCARPVRRSGFAGAPPRRFSALHQAASGDRAHRRITPPPTPRCKGIAKGIDDFYEKQVSRPCENQETRNPQRRDRTAADLQAHHFPEMKVNWQTHPNNLGHYYFNGCFRCHDGQHVSTDGKVISKDCNQCHTLMSRPKQRLSRPPV